MYRSWYAVCNDFQKLTVGSRERPTTAVWMSRGQAWVQWLATGATVVTSWRGIPVAFARLQRLGQGLSPPAGVSPLLLGVHALWVGCCVEMTYMVAGLKRSWIRHTLDWHISGNVGRRSMADSVACVAETPHRA